MVELRGHLDAKIKQYTKDYGENAIERIDGQECELPAIIDSLGGLSLFSSNKLVLLRAPGSIPAFAIDPGKVLVSAPETTEVIIIEPKLDKRSTYYKYLKQHTQLTDFVQPSSQQLPRWVQQRVTNLGGIISSVDASYLVDRIGASQLQLASEIDKLLLYGSSVNRASINQLTDASPQTTIFELVDAAFAKNPRKALGLYSEQRALGVEPQQIVAMLTWQLHILAVVKAAGTRSQGEIATQAKLSPFTVGKASTINRRITLAELRAYIADLLQIDMWTKRTKIDLDEALQTYLLQLAA